MADYNLGGTVRIDDPETLALLVEEDAIRHIQVQAFLLPEPAFRERIAAIALTGIPVVVHAPYHSHGVNPCAPAAYDDRSLPDIRAHIEGMMNLTYEAADTLGADAIVLHAGRYPPGERREAEEEFPRFLDAWADPRLTLENLPSVFAGYPLLGNTAGELAALAGNTITRFCLDFSHLACTTNYRNLSFADELEQFETLDVALHHLSNIRHDSIIDEHLELDHPDGGLDMTMVFARLRQHPAVPTTLEYKRDSPEVYTRQVDVFARLWKARA